LEAEKCVSENPLRIFLVFLKGLVNFVDLSLNKSKTPGYEKVSYLSPSIRSIASSVNGRLQQGARRQPEH